jgi:hypothetical protein
LKNSETRRAAKMFANTSNYSARALFAGDTIYTHGAHFERASTPIITINFSN